MLPVHLLQYDGTFQCQRDIGTDMYDCPPAANGTKYQVGVEEARKKGLIQHYHGMVLGYRLDL